MDREQARWAINICFWKTKLTEQSGMSDKSMSGKGKVDLSTRLLGLSVIYTKLFLNTQSHICATL